MIIVEIHELNYFLVMPYLINNLNINKIGVLGKSIGTKKKNYNSDILFKLSMLFKILVYLSDTSLAGCN